MKLRFQIALLPMLWATPVVAQPVDMLIPPSTAAEYPAGIKLAKIGGKSVYVDRSGHTLYGMDMRVLVRWAPDPSQFCQDACAQVWEPLLAPPEAKPNVRFPPGFGSAIPQPKGQAESYLPNQSAPDWAIIQGAQGPQWIYKGWHLVFVRKGEKVGSAQFDGADSHVWNTLKYVPPVPKPMAPAGVAAVFRDGRYVLADKDGRSLFTGKCSACSWQPMAAGMADSGVGDWTVDSTGDQPQWRYRGQLVFINQEDDLAAVPPKATILRP